MSEFAWLIRIGLIVCMMASSNGNIFHVTGFVRGIHQWPVNFLHKGQFSALLAFCAENSPVTGEFPAQRPVTRSFDVFFDLRLNQQLSKQWRRW